MEINYSEGCNCLIVGLIYCTFSRAHMLKNVKDQNTAGYKTNW